jgi:hypothetical protein
MLMAEPTTSAYHQDKYHHWGTPLLWTAPLLLGNGYEDSQSGTRDTMAVRKRKRRRLRVSQAMTGEQGKLEGEDRLRLIHLPM